MKNSGMAHLLIGLMFIVVIASVAVNYKLYSDCMGKITSSEKQSKIISDKINKFEMGLDGLRLNIDSLKSDLQSVSEKSSQSNELKNEFSAKIDMLQKQLQDLQTNYTVIISDLDAKISALKASLDASKKVEEKQVESKQAESKQVESKQTEGKTPEGVDLGEISVQTPN